MQKLDLKRSIRNILSKTWAQWLIAAGLFFSMSLFLMGSSVTSCANSTISLNSDSTGGLAWFQWASGNDLSWDYTTKSNYPVGEQLNRPQAITTQALTTTYKVLAALTTPICGLNLLILLGYMSTGLLMFGLVKWLLRSGGIAMLAGFAAAFAPYYQLKSQSHIVYMYSSVFIAIVWAFLWFISKPSYRKLLVLAAVTALSAYVDGYFVLLTGLLLGSLIGFTLLRRVFSLTTETNSVSLSFRYKELFKNISTYFKYGLALFLSLIVLTIPVALVLHSQGSNIQKSLAAARGNIFAETVTYGIRPLEFVLPAHNNIFANHAYETWRLNHMHDSNPSENTLFLGFTVIVLSLVALIGLLKRRTRIKELRPNLTYGFVAYLLIGVAAVCIIMGLPSRSTLFGITFHTPVWVFVHFTENWRVFARLFLVIQPMFVLLAALGLWFIRTRLSKNVFRVLLSVLLVVVFLEFLPTPHSTSQSLINDTPKIFTELRDDSNVRVLAEYPLTELFFTPTTFTFQQIHGKSVINSNDSAIIKGPMNESIAGLGDAQTLGVLKAKGVTHVVAYGVDGDNIKGLVIYKSPDTSHRFGLPDIHTYSITDSVQPRKRALVFASGFSFAGINKDQISSHVTSGNGTLEVVPLSADAEDLETVTARFDMSAFNIETADVTIRQNGAIVWQGQVTKSGRSLELPVSVGTIDIESTAPIAIQNPEVN